MPCFSQWHFYGPPFQMMVWHLLLTGSSKRWHFTRDYLVNLGQVVTYVFELPFSRAQENEADEVCSSSSKGNRGRVLRVLSSYCEIETLQALCLSWFYFYFPGGSSLCCQSLLWCEGSSSFLGCDATYGRGENSASRNCVHLYRLTNKGWGWHPGGPGPGDCRNFGFCIYPPRWLKKAG